MIYCHYSQTALTGFPFSNEAPNPEPIATIPKSKLFKPQLRKFSAILTFIKSSINFLKSQSLNYLVFRVTFC
jgi:hypothetical protein